MDFINGVSLNDLLKDPNAERSLFNLPFIDDLLNYSEDCKLCHQEDWTARIGTISVEFEGLE